MPLPTLNSQSKQPDSTEQDNQRPFGQPQTSPRVSTFGTMAKNFSQDFNQQFSVVPNVQRGLYGAFGNNAITRTAAGAVSSLGDAFDTLVNGPRDPNEDLTETDKLLKQQVELLSGMKTSLSELAKEQTQNALEGGSNVLDGLIRVIEAGDEKIGAGLEAIRLEVGNVKEALTGGTSGLDYKEPIENKLIPKELKGTDVIKAKPNEKPLDKGQIQVLNQLKDAKSFLKNISFTASKILEKLTKGNDQVTADVPFEDQLKEKLDLGAMKDKKGSSKSIGTDDEGDVGGPGFLGGIIGALMSSPELLAKLAKNLASRVLHFVEEMKEKIGEKFGEKFGKMKDAIGDVAESAGKKLGSLKEKAAEKFQSASEKGSELLKKVKVPEFIKKAAEKMSPKALMEGLGKLGKGTAKMIPGLGALVTGGIAAYDAFDAGSNAEEVLDIKGRKATKGEKIEAGIGGAAESLSFGLLDKKKTAKWIDGLFSSEQSKAKSDIEKMAPPAPAAGQPDAGKKESPTIIQSKNETNNYVSSRRFARNGDESFNRYLDKTYTF